MFIYPRVHISVKSSDSLKTSAQPVARCNRPWAIDTPKHQILHTLFIFMSDTPPWHIRACNYRHDTGAHFHDTVVNI